MKIQKLIFTYLILLTTFQICFGQEKSELKSLGSIPPYNCEYVNQYVDSLMDELEKNPNAVGYIVINWQPKQLNRFNFARLGGFVYQDIMSVHIKNRNFNQSRVKIIRSKGDKFKIDFFVGSNVLDKPNFIETAWNLSIPSKPIIFNMGMGGQLCNETFFQLNTFSEFLAANPSAHGRFEIYAKSLKDFQKEKANIANEVKKAGISLNRIKFFFIKDNSTGYSFAELWLVPKNKK